MTVKSKESLKFAEPNLETEEQVGQEAARDTQDSQNNGAALAPFTADQATVSTPTQTLLNGLEDVLSPAAIMTPRIELSVSDQRALALLHQAKQGIDQRGGYVAGVERKRYLNRALATLWPTLSALSLTQSEAIGSQLRNIEEDVAQLRDEIRQKIGEEAHQGGGYSTQSVKQAEQLLKDAKLSELGSLAWKLAQLGRKKRRRFDPSPTDDSIAHAKNGLDNTATMLGTLAARLTLLEVRIEQTPKQLSGRLAVLKNQQGAVRFEFVGAVGRFLRDCLTESQNPGHVSAHQTLRTRFAALAESAPAIDCTEEALPMAIKIVKLINECIPDESENQ